MEAIIAGFFLISLWDYAAKLVLSPNRKFIFALVPVTYAFSIWLYPNSIEHNSSYVSTLLQDGTILHGFVLAQVWESLTCIYIAQKLLSNPKWHVQSKWLRLFYVIPSPAVFCGFYISQIIFFLNLSGLKFFLISLVYASAIILLLAGSYFFLEHTIHRVRRREIKLISSAIVSLNIFLILSLSNIQPMNRQYDMSFAWSAMFVCMGICILSLLVHLFQKKQAIANKKTFSKLQEEQ